MFGCCGIFYAVTMTPVLKTLQGQCLVPKMEEEGLGGGKGINLLNKVIVFVEMT